MDTDFEKYTYEQFPIECDFANVLDTGETLVVANCEIKIYDEDGKDVTTAMYVDGSISVADGSKTSSKLKAKIKAGTADAKYTVKFKATSSASNKFQLDKTLYVKYENT